MVKALKFAAVSAIFCDLEACDAMNAYEAVPPGVKRGPMSTQDFIR